MAITSGKKVSIEYTLTLENNEVVDTNVGGEPLTYVHGSNQIISGLEQEIEGMEIGETKHAAVEAEDGYGAVIQEAIIEASRDQLPPDAWKVGAQVQGKGPDEQILRGLVTEIRDDKAIIDFNHPLAGKKLFFKIKVLDIQ